MAAPNRPPRGGGVRPFSGHRGVSSPFPATKGAHVLLWRLYVVIMAIFGSILLDRYGKQSGARCVVTDRLRCGEG